MEVLRHTRPFITNTDTMEITSIIAKTLGLGEGQVANTIQLLSEGATIPFISRYRKEATGGLDEVQVAAVQQQNDRLTELVRRREYILKTIEEQGKLTDELKARISGSWDANELEDLYLPFKPKRRTRAEVARKRGLEPLADILLKSPFTDPAVAAEKFINSEVPDTESALQGARDILAELISEDDRTRSMVRGVFRRTAVIVSKVVKAKEGEAAKFRDYFDFSERLNRCSRHRLLAMRRGEAEGYLRVSIVPADVEECMERVARPYVKVGSKSAEQMELAATDAYKRLLGPAIETEFSAESKRKADEEAIGVFANNLKQLLLAAPLGAKRIMGIDPGYRTGCKVVCLDEQGNLLHHEAIFPHPPRSEWAKSACTISSLVEKYGVQAIAVGNGTAGRETEELLKSIPLGDVEIYMVSEDGASVYSASKIAREEFPDEDVTVRGAVSIGRQAADLTFNHSRQFFIPVSKIKLALLVIIIKVTDRILIASRFFKV